MKKIFIIALIVLTIMIPVSMVATGCSNNRERTLVLTPGEHGEIHGWTMRFNSISITNRNATMRYINFNVTITNGRNHARQFSNGSLVYINGERYNRSIGGMPNQYMPFETRTGVFMVDVPIEDATFENEFVLQVRVRWREGAHEYVRFVAGGNA